MAFVYLSLVLLSGVLTLVVIRLRFGPGRVKRKLALPVAVAERTLADALQDLTDKGIFLHDMRLMRVPDELFPEPSEHQVLVNAFEPMVDKLARFSVADIASLGKDAARDHGTLLQAVLTWNATAGRVEDAETLLPTVLAGYQAARQLGEHLGDAGELARSAAEHRLLFGLVGEPDPRGLPH